MIPLKEAIKFHGHLGPYLVLGLLAGELGLKKTGAKKYFGLEVKVYGVSIKPKSCLIDGLQLSTGATYGKGNIRKYASARIKVIMRNTENNKTVTLRLKGSLIKELDNLRGHLNSENFARRLLKIGKQKIFTLN
ncbi:MAG: formylmethanofuran dehydrogenase subunit E family protein [Candidatus Omnitrophica bacterium]|nr:formylmethanofuran dehydrogenase subunit E family protein [Candidatus Omnitrophota bacterium]MDD5027039.1 formylmethanofuran dehydrogenase subunit E family protein [Candidatus Omnitrophota bacterium]MDD5661841.1 formylmethanofuran dehydrogenase subunit E family protein [Candidatus Omnitrophota bacterium]